MKKTVHDIENACLGKEQFATRLQAQKAAASLSKGKRKMQHYKCVHCGFHHIGHSVPKKTIKFRRDLKRSKIDPRDFDHIHPGLNKGFCRIVNPNS